MRYNTHKSKGVAALEVVGRLFMGALVLVGTVILADDIQRGVIKGRYGVFAVGRSEEPVLFWLLVAASAVLLAVMGFGAIRGFDRKSE